MKLKVLILRVNPLFLLTLGLSLCIYCFPFVNSLFLYVYLSRRPVHRKSIIKIKKRLKSTRTGNFIRFERGSSPTSIIWEISIINNREALFFSLFDWYGFTFQLFLTKWGKISLMVNIDILNVVKDVNRCLHLIDDGHGDGALWCYFLTCHTFGLISIYHLIWLNLHCHQECGNGNDNAD